MSKFKRVGLFVFLVFIFSACDFQRKEKSYPLHYSDAIMGTSFTVKVSSLSTSLSGVELKLQIKSLLDKLNGQMSTYIEDSELSQFNQNASTHWQAVSLSLYTVLKEAKGVADLTNGAFDITVGPLVNLWGFGPDAITYSEPKAKDIEKKLENIGFEYLLFEDNLQQIRKKTPELYLDLSAIAKGYAVDQVGLLLEKHGITDYMVEIGGELRLKGKNIQNQLWRIAIEKPTSNQRIIQRILPLTDISLATSGDYRNFFEVDNIRFSHTIDPRSGKPITHKLASVTILSDTTMEADALATALLVLGQDDGFKLAEEQNIAALFIIKTENGFIEKASPAFIKKIK